jgi:hypothetical protein
MLNILLPGPIVKSRRDVRVFCKVVLTARIQSDLVALRSGVRVLKSSPHSPGIPDLGSTLVHPCPNSRYRRGESYAVSANPILGGLHHEYSLAPACT